MDILRRWVSGRSGVFPNPSFPKTSSEGALSTVFIFLKKECPGTDRNRVSRARARDLLLLCDLIFNRYFGYPCLGVEVSYGPR